MGCIKVANDRRFYVYEHWRIDRDECFYVGMGQGRRANAMYNRNRHHKFIQDKLARAGLGVEIRLETIAKNKSRVGIVREQTPSEKQRRSESLRNAWARRKAIKLVSEY